MIIKIVKVVSPALLLAFPVMVFAQGRIVFLLQDVKFIVDLLITLVAAIALLVFFWGLVKFISVASVEGKSEGKNFMIWGVVALFVMVSVWGLVRFIGGELGVNVNEPAPRVPTFRSVNTSSPGIQPNLPSRNLPIPLYTSPQL